MLGAFADANDNRAALVVDFRQIFSLPVAYLQRHAANWAAHRLLQSPFREHFPRLLLDSSCGLACQRQFHHSNELVRGGRVTSRRATGIGRVVF